MSTLVDGSIASALFGKTRRNLLAIFFSNTGEELYLRQIVKLTSSGRGAVQRELENLLEAGIITRRKQSRLTLYAANKHSPVYPELKSLISKTCNQVSSEKIKNMSIPKDTIARFCHLHYIRRLSLFGSILGDDFGPESDIDVLVEFEPNHVPSFFGLFDMEAELSTILNGRKVDLRTPRDLSRYFREQVVKEAKVQYAKTR
jgi:predicted nucleotidyltransferase